MRDSMSAGPQRLGYHRVLSAAARLPLVRRLRQGPLAGQGAYWLARCAPCVRPSARFVARELAGRPRTDAYRARSSGRPIHYRHPFLDAWVVDEIFYRRVYEPPAEVVEALARLRRPLNVADLGAHTGLASVFLLERFDVGRLVAFEPHPANASLLRRTLAANAPDGAWRVVEACAAASAGDVALAGDAHLSRIDPDGGSETITVPAVDAFEHLGDADLLKIDVQGGEWDLLASPRFAQLPARALVLEYHPHLSGTDRPLERARELLAAAGFASGPPFDVRGPEGVVWAWKP